MRKGYLWHRLSKGSAEPAQPRSLARAFAIHSQYREQVKIQTQTDILVLVMAVHAHLIDHQTHHVPFLLRRLIMCHVMRKHIVCHMRAIKAQIACASAQSDQGLGIRCLDSILPTLAKSNISRLFLVSVTEQHFNTLASLCNWATFQYSS